MPIQFVDIDIPDAKLTSSDEQRAQATFREGKSQHVLHLIRKYERWWISGYSLEHAGNLDALQKAASESGQTLDGLIDAAAHEHQGVIEITERLKAGEFKTVQEFHQAAAELFGG